MSSYPYPTFVPFHNIPYHNHPILHHQLALQHFGSGLSKDDSFIRPPYQFGHGGLQHYPLSHLLPHKKSGVSEVLIVPAQVQVNNRFKL